MLHTLRVTMVVCLSCLCSCCSSAYELQDTIHTLKEENLHLHHRLENFTWALRDLKHLLTEHAKIRKGGYDPEYLHAWREWSQHGISTETHRIMKQVLCLNELHDAARHHTFICPGFLLLFFLVSMTLTLLS